MDNEFVEDPDLMRRWVAVWKQAGPELEAIRRREIQEADNLKVLESLTSAIHHAMRLPPRPSSGLVEMQRLFAKLRPPQE